MQDMKFPPQLFVTGTDTGVGKTIVSAALVQALGATYWKPIQSGIEEETDTEFVRRITGLPDFHFLPEKYKLTQPLSPHASAAIDGVAIKLEKFELPKHSTEHLIVEGAGGLMVPMNERHYVIDLIAHLNIPVVLVSRSTLGTINHTLLSLSALRSRGIAVFGVVMNGPKNQSNRQAIEFYGRVPVIAEIEHMELSTASLACVEWLSGSAVFNRHLAGTSKND